MKLIVERDANGSLKVDLEHEGARGAFDYVEFVKLVFFGHDLGTVEYGETVTSEERASVEGMLQELRQTISTQRGASPEAADTITQETQP